MKRIAKFEKVSLKQFIKDWKDTFKEDNEIEIRNIYEEIKLPQRGTSWSAGYDFFAPTMIILSPNETIKIPTGIRCKMKKNYALFLFPRSGLGFKYRLQIDNTVGIVDSDYYSSDNEGHIFIKITNDSKENNTVIINNQDGFVQGIFLPFGITLDDKVKTKRNGGFGSTTKK